LIFSIVVIEYKWNVPGLAVGVVKDNEIIYSGELGLRKRSFIIKDGSVSDGSDRINNGYF
jgi:hypothetical protein